MLPFFSTFTLFLLYFSVLTMFHVVLSSYMTPACRADAGVAVSLSVSVLLQDPGAAGPGWTLLPGVGIRVEQTALPDETEWYDSASVGHVVVGLLAVQATVEHAFVGHSRCLTIV